MEHMDDLYVASNQVSEDEKVTAAYGWLVVGRTLGLETPGRVRPPSLGPFFSADGEVKRLLQMFWGMTGGPGVVLMGQPWA